MTSNTPVISILMCVLLVRTTLHFTFWPYCWLSVDGNSQLVGAYTIKSRYINVGSIMGASIK